MSARNLERELIRKVEKAAKFSTVTGNVNELAAVTKEAIVFTTSSSGKENKITRKKLRAAINFLQVAKTVTRKELERFSCFSSALLGLLASLFSKRLKVVVSETGLIRITLEGVRYVFAGVDRSVRDMEVAADNGAEFFLMSFIHIQKRKAWKKHLLRLGKKLIVDSSAFTAWKKGVTINIDEYISFIKEHSDVIHSYFNLDVVGDSAASKANAEYMKAHGLNPIEVYHIGDDMAVLDALVTEGHAVIGIGGSVGKSEAEREAAFTEIFAKYPGQNFHFLGGGSKLVAKFNWFSADSTTWISSRKYNVITDENGQRKAEEMSALECLAYTVRYFAGLEAA